MWIKVNFLYIPEESHMAFAFLHSQSGGRGLNTESKKPELR